MESEKKIIISCICCLNESPSKNVWEEYSGENDDIEVYGLLIQECFKIKLPRQDEVDCNICEDCIVELRRSWKFRKLILYTQEELVQYLDLDKDISNADESEEDSEVEERPEQKKRKRNTKKGKDGKKKDYELGEEVEITFEPNKVDQVEKNVTDFEYLEGDEDFKDYIHTMKRKHVDDSQSKHEDIDSDTPKSFAFATGKRRSYTEKQFTDCIKAIKSGKVNQYQASMIFKIPRQTIQAYLKRELGSQGYADLKSKWAGKRILRSHAPMNVDGVVINDRDMALESCLHEIKNGSLSLGGATVKYQIATRTIRNALEQEYGPDLEDVLLDFRRKHFELRKSKADDQGKRKRRIDQAVLIKAIADVRNKVMSVNLASKRYDIPYKLIDRIVTRNIDVESSDINEVLHRRVRNKISTELLLECLHVVRAKEMTMKDAAEIYGISTATISKKLKMGDELLMNIRENDEEEEFEEDEHNQETEEVEDIEFVVEVSTSNADPTQTEGVEEHSRDPMTLTENVKTILKLTNAIPFEYKDDQFSCIYCKTVTKDPIALGMHFKISHEVVKLDIDLTEKEIMRLDIQGLECLVCSEQIKKWSLLPKHLEKHEIVIEGPEWYYMIPYKLNDYTCAICQEKFSKFNLLDEHMNKHYQNYTCHKCKLGFLTLQRLKTHNEEKKLENKGLCNHCGDNYLDEAKLEKHVKQCPNLKLSCKYCPAKFNDYFPRYLHMREKHLEKLKEMRCNICDDVFYWKPFFKIHMKQHREDDQDDDDEDYNVPVEVVCEEVV